MKPDATPQRGTKAERLRALAYQAYWAAQTPMEAKMAGILMDIFDPGHDRRQVGDGLPA